MRQEAMLSKHSAAFDYDHGDVLLATDGRHSALSDVFDTQMQHYSGAWEFRGHGVFDAHWDTSAPGRQHGRWVHHLGAESRKLRCLLEGEDLHGFRCCDHSGIRGLHAADVFPNLHFRCLHGGSDHGGGEVRAVPAQGSDDTTGILGNVASDNWHEGIRKLQRPEVVLDGWVRLLEDLHGREGGVGASGAAGGLHARLPGIQGPSLRLLWIFP
mmetsp:Transcript_72065/g.168816  ORF Transcript_72065/g.168816 Transcript_72065/m.168816 type:complete len:213 (+) Transcript_72065:546-1184(+)